MTSGKFFVINWRNIFETFVETDLLKCGLNHIMVRFYVFGFSDYCWCILNYRHNPTFLGHLRI